MTELRARLERLSKELADNGKLVEAGWIGLRIAAVDPRASDVQVEEMRMAFFAGAQHLFASIVTILNTEKDLERMDMINRELKEFIDQFELKHLPARGRA